MCLEVSPADIWRRTDELLTESIRRVQQAITLATDPTKVGPVDCVECKEELLAVVREILIWQRRYYTDGNLLSFSQTYTAGITWFPIHTY